MVVNHSVDVKSARFVWNWALHRSQTFYKTNKKGIPQAQLSNELTALKSEQPWLYDFDSQSLQPVLKNLKQAYQNHFNPSMRAGFPKRKTKKNAKQSFRIPLRLSFLYPHSEHNRVDG
jgi:putative transposase